MKTSLTINLLLCLTLIGGWIFVKDTIRYKDYLSTELDKERDARYALMMSSEYSRENS